MPACSLCSTSSPSPLFSPTLPEKRRGRRDRATRTRPSRKQPSTGPTRRAASPASPSTSTRRSARRADPRASRRFLHRLQRLEVRSIFSRPSRARRASRSLPASRLVEKTSRALNNATPRSVPAVPASPRVSTPVMGRNARRSERSGCAFVWALQLSQPRMAYSCHL